MALKAKDKQAIKNPSTRTAAQSWTDTAADAEAQEVETEARSTTKLISDPEQLASELIDQPGITEYPRFSTSADRPSTTAGASEANPRAVMQPRFMTRTQAAAREKNSKRLQIVCTPTDHQTLLDGAAAADMSFNQWALMVLLDEATKLRDGH